MKKARRFTGYHASGIIVAFFAAVIAVNLTMAGFAVSTFGGTVVGNSYVASQKFNGWLEEARRQRQLGWQVADPVLEDGHLVIAIADALHRPLSGAIVATRAEHPLGRVADRDLSFSEIRPGRYLSVEPLPAGRWKLRVRIIHDRSQQYLAFEVRP